MKPSVSRHELRNQTDNTKTYKNKMGCPDGTVPILRNSKEYITNAQLFAEKYFHPLSSESPGSHVSIQFFLNSLVIIIFICIFQVLFMYIFVTITGFW